MRLQAALIFVAALAACSGQSASDKPGERPEAEAAAEPAFVKRQPGSWAMVHYTMVFDAENVAGGMAELVEAGQASVGKKEFGGPLCLDAKFAAKDDLGARLKEAIRLGPEFRVIRSGLENGKVDFAAVSKDPESGTSRITITGNLTPTTSDLVVTTEAWQPAPGQGYIRAVMKQENSRVGDCLPGQDPWQ